MDTDKVRMMQLARKGYLCSQILILMGLEAKGENNPDLVRAVGGLAGGCDEGSCTCGALTGGCCLLALFTGKGSEEEERDEHYHQMMKELVHWFWKDYGFVYGGIDCMAIREAGGQESSPNRCWQIMDEVYSKVLDILAASGISMSLKDCYAS